MSDVQIEIGCNTIKRCEQEGFGTNSFDKNDSDHLAKKHASAALLPACKHDGIFKSFCFTC